MNLEPKLELEIIWKDEHMVELRVVANNGRYLGTTEVYETGSYISEFSQNLGGFPKTLDEKIIFEAGEKDSYAYFSMRFYCIDSVGHTAVQIQLEENVGTEYRPEEKDKLTMEMLFEPGALDQFKEQLFKMGSSEQGKAVLIGKKA